MTLIVLILFTVVFIGVVFALARVIVLQLEQRADEDVLRSKETYQNIIEQKNKVHAERSKLEREASQIFTLYEMTKEITRHFNEQEAFDIFRQKLRDNITIQDCRMVDDLDKAGVIPADYEIFPLKSKDKQLGFLLHKGIPKKDRQKFAILANQFALAYRRIKLYKDIEALAIMDSLTAVYTRRYFLQRLEEEISRSKLRGGHFCFIMLDVDHFKKVNDQYGHLAGDEVLRSVAATIKESVREIDFTGRYGGEEFCLVLPDTDIAGAMLVAQRIRKAVEQKLIRAYDASIHVTISIGISTYPSDGQVADELIDKADWSLYRAKSQGRNCVIAFGEYNTKS